MAADNRLRGIRIDFTGEFYNGFDQAYDSFPCVFPTVNIALDGDHDGLLSMAYEVRRRFGETDNDKAWYDFNVGLNGYTKTHTDNCINFVVYGDIPDDGCEYTIDLDEEEQAIVYDALNKELRDNGFHGCEQLLMNAAAEQAGGEETLTIIERR